MEGSIYGTMAVGSSNLSFLLGKAFQVCPPPLVCVAPTTFKELFTYYLYSVRKLDKLIGSLEQTSEASCLGLSLGP